MEKKLLNKNLIIFLVISAIFLGTFVLAGNNKNKKTGNRVGSNSLTQDISTKAKEETKIEDFIPADKIEIVHFHGTQQCWSCIKVGEYALKTIEEKFPEEYTEGKIVFEEVNGELKENYAIVAIYQARGSSLFINTYKNDNNKIVEDVNVWRYVADEDTFMEYFEEKISTLLGN